MTQAQLNAELDKAIANIRKATEKLIEARKAVEGKE